jgi:hypothetical protein
LRFAFLGPALRTKFAIQTEKIGRKCGKSIKIGISSVQLTSSFLWKVIKFESHLLNFILSVCRCAVRFDPWEFLEFNHFPFYFSVLLVSHTCFWDEQHEAGASRRSITGLLFHSK